MARIRSIKPEFWTDDLIGSISRDDRLLFIASWNMADDEGLLRWSAPYLKGAVFPFDNDISVKDVQKSMDAIVSSGLVHPYFGGRSRQPLGWVVNFHKHQKINRPSPSRIQPPSLQDQKVRDIYAARDGYMCHLCGGKIDERWSDQYEGDFLCSPDHVRPLSRGGTDYPSNIKASHVTCNKGKGDRSTEEYQAILRAGKTTAQLRFPERFTNLSSQVSLNPSVSKSLTEQDREQEKDKEIEKDSRAVAPAPRPGRDELFEEFWKIYPKRDGANPKQPARKLFVAALKAGTEASEIIAGAMACADRDREKIGTPYIPQAVKWLRDRRWEDYGMSAVLPTSTGPPAPIGWRPGLRTAEEILGKSNGQAAETDRGHDQGNRPQAAEGLFSAGAKMDTG